MAVIGELTCVLTAAALGTYESTTREICKTWLKKAASFNGQPINTSLFSLLVTFDHMGRVGFSQNFRTIEAGEEHRMLDLIEVLFGQLGQLGELSWPLALLQSLGVGGDAAEFDALACKMADRRDTVSQAWLDACT